MSEDFFLNGKFLQQRLTGVQRTASRLVQALDQRLERDARHWVLLCPPDAPPPVLQHIEVRRIGSPGGGLHAWEQTVLPQAARDGLLINLAGTSPWFGARQACLLHDAAVFDHPQGYGRAFRTWYRMAFRRAAKRAEQLLTVSEFSRQRLALHLRLQAERIAVVPNGADHLREVCEDTSVLDRLDLRGQPYFVALGPGRHAKNHEVLRAALHAAGDIGHRLVVVGEPHARVFGARSGANGADARCLMAGAVSDAQLKALYVHASALVFPSLYEGFGLPPLEAMDNGCPVLVCNRAALPEVCGDAALYAEPSAPALAQALGRLARDGALRRHLSEAGRHHARRFRWDRSAQALLTALSAGTTA